MVIGLATEQDRDRWDQFVARAPGGSFLQSWRWGDVQRAFGLEIWRLIAREQEEVVGAALVVKRSLPTGQGWLYIPRGPVWGNQESGIPEPVQARFRAGRKQALLDHVVALAREEGALFVRIEPSDVPSEGWRKALKDVQPRHTVLLDLREPVDQLLAAMHHKTRYNIRLAEKRGVSIRFSTKEEDIELFLRLAREVSGRGDFRFHPDDYYRSLMDVLGRGAGGATAELAVAEHEGTTLAVHILISFGDTVTYAHGASSSAKREVMVPHLLQWGSIMRAKEKGYAHYDFFGVAPPPAGGLAPVHPWAGITRFKEGFGGQRVNYAGAYDFVLSQPSYWLYTVAHKLKR